MKRSDLSVALLATILIAAAWLAPSIARADEPASESELQVERQLGCPVCTNLPLNVCDNQICLQMKGVIRDKLAAGETPDQVVAFFVSRYGDGVLLTPPQQGFSLAVWYFPVVAVLLGAFAIGAFLQASLLRQSRIDRRLGDADPDLEAYRREVRRDVDGSGDRY
ncbi:MAG TPA: cytochrome c-type biogenesis protein [Chloroflexota bacterium]|nr:cytochrome c-type biogenesis protein [Chloroflexota bacterium]